MDTNQQSIAEWRLTKLNNAFVYHMDSGDFETMISLFTPDGYFDRVGTVHHGQEEIRQGMRERPKVTTRHLLTNFHFTNVTPESADATICAMVYHGPPQENGQPVVYATDNGRLVEFHDKYVMTPDGWRIKSRTAAAVFTPGTWP